VTTVEKRSKTFLPIFNLYYKCGDDDFLLVIPRNSESVIVYATFKYV